MRLHRTLLQNTRSRRLLFLLFVALLIAAAWWHWHTPAPRLVRKITIPNSESYFWSRHDGVLIFQYHDNTTVSLYSWTGQELWKIDSPQHSQINIYRPEWISRHHGFAASPNGQLIATVVTINKTNYLYSWQNGQSLPSVTLPWWGMKTSTPEETTTSLSVLDDGRVFIYPDEKMDCPLLIARNGHIIARGYYRSSLKVENNQYLERILSADATTMIESPIQRRHLIPATASPRAYIEVLVKGDHVQAVQRYQDNRLGRYPLTGGKVIDISGGRLYDKQGLLWHDKSKMTIPPRHSEETALLIIDEYRYNSIKMKVHDPNTGQNWPVSIHPITTMAQFDYTTRYVAFSEEATLADHLGPVSNIVPSIFFERITRPKVLLSIYERPGRLCAKGIVGEGGRLDLWYLCIAPVGRQFVVSTDRKAGSDSNVFSFYRW